MKKILLSFLISFFLVLQASAGFNSSFTSISSSKTFLKNSGVEELRVSEDYFIDPFSSSVIKRNTTICTGNDCPCGASGCSYVTSYTVDGALFGPSHPKFKSSNATRRDWYDYSDGIDSKIVYVDNTYTIPDGIYKPNQTVKVRRYYIITYQHDTSTPTCGEVNYYNDEELTTGFTYSGGWLNKPKYFIMTCHDSETGCYCAPDDESCKIRSGKVISTAQLLGHNIKPQVSFTNRVKLTDTTCEPGGTFQKVLFDLKTPKFDIALGGESFQLNTLTLRDYKLQSGKKLDGIEVPGKLSFTRSGSINQISGNTFIDLEIEDAYLADSVHGVSGLKDYTFTITRLTNKSFETTTPQVITSCTRTDTSSTQYNPDGNKESSDIKNTSFNCNELTTAGKYNFKFIANDWAGNTSIANTTVNIFPDEISLPNSSLVLKNPSSSPYANNIDSYNYELNLKDQYGNPIFDRVIVNPVQSITAYSGGETINLSNSTTALRYSIPSNKTNNQGRYVFSVRSLLHGTLTHRFSLSYRTWDNNYIQNSTTKSLYLTNNTTGDFIKPFSANLVLVGPGDTPEVGTEQNYKINVINDGNIANISSPKLNITPSTLNFSSGHRFSSIKNIDDTFALNDLQCNFTGIFDATSASSVLSSPELDINNMGVSYTLDGQRISYLLTTFGLNGCEVSTLGLRTLGSTQGDGKGEITGGTGNFSDVSTSTLRSQIRENAYKLVRGLDSGDIVNSVRYVEGDTTISGNLAYETLIVKNGNVFISGNLNTSGNTLGIIVLKDDGYNIVSDYNNQGNVYIANSVETINAHIYADGTLRSANLAGTDYSDSMLGLKLRMKGSLFTRNTIGGGISAGGNYILPGGATTTDSVLAGMFDLNYIRRAQTCGEIDDYSFLIEYDSTIQANPPKGFETK